MASILKGAAFITGAASGIGQYTALSFARHGVKRLALADMNGATLQAANKALKDRFPDVEILPLQLNVLNTKEVKDGIAETVKRFDRLDIAVNNAGIGNSGVPTHEVPEEEWRNILGVNLDGVWRCQKEEIAIMVKQEDLGLRQGRGTIINTASMYGLVAPNREICSTAYAASKHGVVGLTKGDANTYGSMNIRINAICPGYVKTPQLVRLMDLDPGSPLAKEIERTPMKRLANMEEIGDCITFLASPMASFMNGATLTPDGGFTSQ